MVRSCFSLTSSNANYILGNTLAYFRDRFAININQCILNDNIKKIKLTTVISNDEQLIINNIWSFLLVKSNQYSVQGFDVSEIGDIPIIYTHIAVVCCCLPTPMTLASGGSPMFPPVVHQTASPSNWSAVQSLRRGLSTNPGATMWCVCGCS